MTTPRNRLRRAGMYLAVLVTAMIVAVIGTSALTVVGVELRMAEGGNDVGVARVCAQSAIEAALFAIRKDSNWRTRYDHDKWVPELPLGEGMFTWKLVDEDNGSLTADWMAPVRLYGRGHAGDAVRIYSALLCPENQDQNLLDNPGFENGIEPWDGLGECDLDVYTDWPYKGGSYLWVKNRYADWAGPHHEISDSLERGEEYELQAWVRTKDFAEPMYLVIYLDTDYGWIEVRSDPITAHTYWALIEATLTPNWPGTLHEAHWKLETYFSRQNFMVDEAVLRVATDPADMAPVHGTWRREVE